MRVIYRFKKVGRLRFVSHLDLQRYMHRAINRTELPVAFSLGFNPHPIISFASALAVGWESEYELLDIKLQNPISRRLALETMAAALPEELGIIDLRFVDDSFTSLTAALKCADYTITPTENFEALKQGARLFCVSESVPGIRKTKSGERQIDLKPLCLKLNANADSFIARLMLTEADTLKPDLLMSKIAELAGLDSYEAKIVRTCLLGSVKDGELKPLMELK